MALVHGRGTVRTVTQPRLGQPGKKETSTLFSVSSFSASFTPGPGTASALGLLVLEGQGHGYKAGTSVCHLPFLLHGWPGGPGAAERPSPPTAQGLLCWPVDPRSQWLTLGTSSSDGL